MGYVMVFNVGQQGANLWSAAFGSAAVLVGLLLFRYRQWPRRQIAVRYAVAVFSGLIGLWTVLDTGRELRDYYRCQRALRNGEARVVEGVVENFVPMPYGGHALEHFTVRGVPFAYSDFVATCGFRNTSTHGGPIRQGIAVRIHYLDGDILSLEIMRP